MKQFQIVEYFDREVITTFTTSHPALEGMDLRGFLLSDDRRACVVIEPIPESEPHEHGERR